MDENLKETSLTKEAVYSRILHTARTIFTPGQVVELRVIFKSGQIASGYFDDFELLAKEATNLDSNADIAGVYWTLNPVNSECLHRAKNRIRFRLSKKDTTTADKEIIERRLILIDFDGANRPAGISATDEEVELAKKKAAEVVKFFSDRGWPAPVTGMSGNGYHLLYKTLLPNDKESADLVKKFLDVLSVRFDDDKISVDRSVFNASRISKVFGTVARKGDNTPERPHRRSRLLTPGDGMVSAEMIKDVAALLPNPPAPKRGRPRKGGAGAIDVHKWVFEHLEGIDIVDERESSYGATFYRLSECPFDPQHKHPDSAIGQFPNGATFFICFHNSCDGNDWDTLRERFDPKSDRKPQKREQRQKDPEEIQREIQALSEETGLPTIELNDEQMRDVTDSVIDAISKAGKDEPLLYVRGNVLARVVMDSGGSLKPGIVNPDAMLEIMSRAANFVRSTPFECSGVFPPVTLARAIVNQGHWPFPTLHGIVSVPVLRKDGSILDTPGYDAVSGLYYHPSGAVPSIASHPTREDAKNAAAFLLDLISDFPFQDEPSRDNALGLLLSVVVKEIVGLIPMALIDAPAKGTGKTKLAQLASIVAAGRELPLTTEAKEDDEWRKRITSLLVADQAVVIIDNLEHILYSPHIAALLTTSEWADRLLGKTETLHLHSRGMWIATGNNIRLGGDLSRRSYWIRLNANMATPWLRDPKDFKRELPTWAIEHRGEIVAALLTMVRAWILDGSPAWSGRPLGSYEKWSGVVGGILQYCGITKFMGNIAELYEQVDDEAAQWEIFFNAIFDTYGEKPFSVKDVLQGISAYSFIVNDALKDALPEGLGDTTAKGFPTRLGIAIRRRRDQIFKMGEGFIQLEEAPKDTHSHKPMWKMKSVYVAPPAAPCAPLACSRVLEK